MGTAVTIPAYAHVRMCVFCSGVGVGFIVYLFLTKKHSQKTGIDEEREKSKKEIALKKQGNGIFC